MISPLADSDGAAHGGSGMSQAIVQQLLFLIFPLCLAYGAISDIMTMTIPNWLVGLMVGAFVLIAPLSGLDLTSFALHWAIALSVLVAAFACFACGWIGGGDAKFTAAIALWLGSGNVLEFLTAAGIAGGALTLAMVVFRGKLLPAFALRQEWLMRLHDPKAGVPYGVALAAAALFVYPDTSWMRLVAL
jgi:prepilin peptidase CpaA